MTMTMSSDDDDDVVQDDDDVYLEFLAVFQGMHLQTCGEVLPLGGSDTCDHAWTSPRSYVQRRLLQHLPMDMTMTMSPDDDDDVRMILLCDVMKME